MKDSTVVNVTAQANVSIGELVRLTTAKGCKIEFWDERDELFARISGEGHESIVYVPGDADSPGGDPEPDSYHWDRY